MAGLFTRRTKATKEPDDSRMWGGYSTPPSWIVRNTFPSQADDEGWRNLDPEQAVTGTIAVYACVSLLADLVGSLPLHLYQRESDDTRTRIGYVGGDRFPGSLARLIGLTPNPEMTAQELWTNLVGHLALWGNGYLEVLRSADGRPSELWPLRPDRIRLVRDRARFGDDSLHYVYTTMRGGEIEVPEVVHVRAFGTDGVYGMSPITVARRTLSGEQKAQRFTDQWYGMGAIPSAIVTVPRGPQDKFKERTGVFRDAFQGMYGGPTNAGRIAVVEEGVSWQQVSMSMADMQFVDTRKFTVTEVARLYRIPPHLVGDVEKSTSWGTGIEQQNLAFLAYTLRPILRRVEEAICTRLGLVPGERTLEDEGIYPEFVTADLLRADLKTRFESYQVAVAADIMRRDEVRRLENLPPLPDGTGMEPVVLQGQAEPAEPVPAENDDLRTALIASLNREPQQLALPNIEVTSPAAPPVTVFNRNVEEGDLERFAAALPATQIDLKPLAKVLAESEARRILDAEQAEARHVAALAELREAVRAVAEAVKPAPPVRMTRKVERDPKTGLITLVEDIPQKEAV